MAALAQQSDLEARLGRDLTTEEAARADALLADASAVVRAYTGRTFELVEDEEIILRAIGDKITLPQAPVLSVTSVVAVGGSTGLPDFPVLDYRFDGIDTIYLGSGACVINLPEAWYDDTDGYPGTYRTVYSYGDAEVPGDVLMVVCSVVQRLFSNPSGYRSETAGSWSATYAVPATGEQLGSNLTRYEMNLLKRYKRATHTVRVTL